VALALVAVTAVWGSTSVLVRDAVAQLPPFTFIAYRFLATAPPLAVVQFPRPSSSSPGRLPAATGRPVTDGGQP
jgi:hypothetical protein